MSMLYQQSGSFGKPIAIYTRYKLLEDATKLAKSDAEIFSARPVTLDENGEVIPVTSNVKVYGLAKANKNQYSDEVSDSYGMYGSKRMTVVVMGIVEVQHNIVTDNEGNETQIDTYDTAQTYSVMDPLYVVTSGTKVGQITNQLVTSGQGQNDKTFLGYVLVPPTATDSTMQILLLK